MVAGAKLHWQLKTFAQMSAGEIYGVMKLRQDVFIVEQMCPFPDLDDKDPHCHHLWAEHEHAVVAYLRLVPPSLMEGQCVSLGRVCTAMTARTGGVGRELVIKGLSELKRLYPDRRCEIGAQTYLTSFYQSVGFRVHGEPYLEDGIPHRHMVYEMSECSHK